MKKIILASVAAGVLAAGIGAASAAEPGEEQYFAQRGNFDAAIRQNPNPGLYGFGSDTQHGYVRGPMGYAPMSGPVFGQPGYYD